MIPFIQIRNQQSTIENWKKILVGNDLPSFGAFAYVTDSGVAQFATHLGMLLNNSRHCRWVFSFDFGRSQPTAIRKLAEVGDSEIRIYDGDYVVQSKGFAPRVTYHLKTAITHDYNGYPCQQIVGSGNLSASGLSLGIEAGCLIDYSQVDPDHAHTFITNLENIWRHSTPIERVIDEYEEKYSEINQPRVNFARDNVNFVSDIDDVGTTRLFWIDVGYVTKNRGPGRPGNQFDLPRGSHIYLGLPEVPNPSLNEYLGEVKIRTPIGDTVERTLRHGNNSMEKLTLPIPEEYGYQCYDGKILVFVVDGDEVILEAFEHDDFLRVYGSYIDSVNEMRSGRKHGTIAFRN